MFHLIWDTFKFRWWALIFDILALLSNFDSLFFQHLVHGGGFKLILKSFCGLAHDHFELFWLFLRIMIFGLNSNLKMRLFIVDTFERDKLGRRYLCEVDLNFSRGKSVWRCDCIEKLELGLERPLSFGVMLGDLENSCRPVSLLLVQVNHEDLTGSKFGKEVWELSWFHFGLG